LSGVALQDPRLRLDDLAEGPEAHALAVGQRAPAPPGDGLRPGLGRAGELVDDPALPDPGRADERHELRLALAPHPVQRVAERRELITTADERRPVLPFHLEGRPGLQRLP